MALRVYVVSGGTAPVLLWSQMGNQGDQWREAEVSVPHTGRLQVRGMAAGWCRATSLPATDWRGSLSADPPGRRAGGRLPQRHSRGRHLHDRQMLR